MSFKIFNSLSKLGVALLGCAVCSFADSPSLATVKGTVTDPSNAAVAGASIRLHEATGTAVFTTTSDSAGSFVFRELAPGEYLIDASAPEMTMLKAETLPLVAGKTYEIAVHLSVSAVKSEISVTAANEPQSTDQVSKALDTISVQETEQRGIFSVADAVRFVPGLRVSTRGSPGSFTTIQTRGLRATDTAVLIDGFRFRDPTGIQGDASAYIGDLLLVDTSRIEVLRGSGSSLYGTNSMSGTINVITEPGGPLHGDLDVQGGGLGLFRGVARIAGDALKDRLSYSAGLSHLNVTEGVDDVGAVRDWSGQAGLNYALGAHLRLGADVFANTGYLQENVSPAPTPNAPVTGIIPAIPLSTAQIHLVDANLPYNPGDATFIPSLGDPDAGRYSHFIDSLFRLEDHLTPRLSYRVVYGIVDTNRNNTNGPAGPNVPEYFQPFFNTSDRYAGRIDTVQARVDYSLGAHEALTGGYEFEQEHYLNVSTDQNPDLSQRAFYRTDARQKTNAVFAQDATTLLGGRLEVLISGRYTRADLDQPNLVGGLSPYASTPLPKPPSAYTGDASVAYLVRSTSTKLRAHVGDSFRLPSIYERFGGYFYGGTYFPLGDPRLSPERAVSIDGGFDQYLFHEHLKVSGTYFYSHLQQVIGFLDFPPGYVDPYGRTGGYYNTGGGISRGVELSGDFRPRRSTAVFASYTYTNAQNRTSQYYTGTGVDPLQSPRILPNVLTIVATQQLKHADFAMDFEAGSDYLYPLYGVSLLASNAYRFSGPRQLGLSAGYSVRVSERTSARFYVRVSNALGQDFYEDGFRTPPRWAVGGIHFSF
ncbi:MAG: TonB-dependent receptor [Acidobacteriaceae bacterium]|nr:TonB-dependent receptor [Acidobacteriaceae bacterium]MBV9778889.1 TonB-dependent receptor [Acidobacteriaceae bacterium]